MVENLVSTYKCPFCENPTISEQNIDIIGAAGNTVNIDMHCPNCNICVAGYDHHCVWMGACIGRKNMKQFVKFNLTWLLFLVYAIVWVSLAGPAIVKRTSHHVGDHDHFNDTNATSNATLPPS